MVGAARHVHAPVQHGPDRRDARDVPHPDPRVPPGRGADLGADRRHPRGDVLLRRAHPLAVLRHPLGPARPPPGDALGTGLRRRRGGADRVHRQPPHPGRHALAGRRVDGRLDPVDPGLHRDRDRRQRGPAGACRIPLRGRHAGGHRHGLHRRAQAVRGAGPDGVPAQRRVLRRVVRDLLLRGQGSRGRESGRRPRAHHAQALPRADQPLPRAPAGTDLDRGQWRHRAVVQPVALPVPAIRLAVPRHAVAAAGLQRQRGHASARS